MRKALIAIEIIAIVLLAILTFSNIGAVKPIFFTLNSKNFTHNAASKYSGFIEPIASSTISYSPSWNSEVVSDTINADSLNERFDYTAPKPADTFRIALLGDSFAFGLYMNTPQNFSELLEDALNKANSCPVIKKIELINFGVPSYDLQYEVERYRLRATKYNPDLVLWFTEAGDLTQVNELLQKDSAEYVATDSNIKDSWDKVHSEYAAQISETDAIQQEISTVPEFNALYKGPLFIFSLPPLFGAPDSAVVKSLTGAFASRPQTFIDLTMAAPWTGQDQVQPSDAHPNQTGSVKLEEALLAYIQSHNLIPCAAK
ncbi:MAG TPA: SGNH/GDSL hydrolase family protein [Candidatus Paceibacterota bacterium]|nr:SGNH/GDSL hydrolase family protein [Candidatus Paceibacterota bacterium]